MMRSFIVFLLCFATVASAAPASIKFLTLSGVQQTGSPSPTLSPAFNQVGVGTVTLQDDGSGNLTIGGGGSITPPLANGKIFVGNGSGIAAAVTPSGDVSLANDGTVTITASAVSNAEIAAAAAIARSKIAVGTVAHVVYNDASTGALSSEAQLDRTRGGTGVSSTATFPASGVVVTEAATETLTNKTLTAPAINTATISAGTALSLTGFSLRDTSAAFDVTLAAVSGTPLTSGRTITLNVDNASRTFNLKKDLTIDTGTVALSGNAAGSAVTLPITGTLATLAGSEVFTNKSISGATNTITAIPLTTAVTGTLPIANGGTNSNTALAGSKAIVSNGSAIVEHASTTATEIGYLAGVTSALQTQLNAKEPTITTLTIAKGGTNSAAALSNNRVMQSLGGAIVEAAAITASRALASDTNGIPVAVATTATELGYVNGVTSALQTQLDGKLTKVLPTAQIFVGDGSNVGAAQAVTGALAITSGGVTSLTSTAYSRDFQNANAGTLAVRDVVYVKSDGTVDKLSGQTSSGEISAVGVNVASLATTVTGPIYVRAGAVISGYSALTQGAAVYVHPSTAGSTTQSLAGFGTTDNVIQLGWAVSATELLFQPHYIRKGTPVAQYNTSGDGVTTSFAAGQTITSTQPIFVYVDGRLEPETTAWSRSGNNVVFTAAPDSASRIDVVVFNQ